MMRWAKEWAKEGVELDPKKLLPAEGPRPFLPRRWVVERTFGVNPIFRTAPIVNF